MPNRVLRDWTDSKKMNKVSSEVERFFTRLMMKADDYGRFNGDPRILHTHLFPHLLNTISVEDVQSWKEECLKVGLIVAYEDNNIPYIEIVEFRQRLRTKQAKFPGPPGSAQPTAEPAKDHIPFPHVQSGVPPKNDFVESLIKDLPNSQALDDACRRAGINKADILRHYPTFVKTARGDYKNAVQIADHFRNWYLKVLSTTTQSYRPKKAGE